MLSRDGHFDSSSFNAITAAYCPNSSTPCIYIDTYANTTANRSPGPSLHASQPQRGSHNTIQTNRHTAPRHDLRGYTRSLHRRPAHLQPHAVHAISPRDTRRHPLCTHRRTNPAQPGVAPTRTARTPATVECPQTHAPNRLDRAPAHRAHALPPPGVGSF